MNKTILTIRYTNSTGNVYISAIKILHDSIAYTIALFESNRRPVTARVTHYIDNSNITVFNWVDVPHYL